MSASDFFLAFRFAPPRKSLIPEFPPRDARVT
jgi:hypothetical protein